MCLFAVLKKTYFPGFFPACLHRLNFGHPMKEGTREGKAAPLENLFYSILNVML